MSVEAKKLIDFTRLSRFKELMDQSIDGKLSKLKIDLVQIVSVLPELDAAEEGVLYLVPAKASGEYDFYVKETVDGVAKFAKKSSLFISAGLDGFLLKADAEKKYISAASVADDTITLSRPDGSTVVITVNNVAHATKADQDDTGAVITATYATKAELTAHAAAAESAYVQTGAVDQTIGGTKTFSKPIAGSVTGSSGSCTGNAATATKATQDSDGNKITTTYSKNGHTHDDRYYTEAEVNNLLAGKANSSHTHPYIPTSASCNKNWHWNGQGGQPTWLWGGEDGTNMYVYNPSNFSVNYANSANSAVTAANGVDSQGGNWIRFRNGIQICWARISCGTSGSSRWTYGASFSSTPVVTVCDQGRNTKSIYLTRAGDIGTTSCLIVMVDENNGSYMSGEAQCMAIGRWK